MLSGPMMPPRAGGTPDSIVILLHGLGDSGAGLIDLAPPLAAHLPNTIFYSPDAPDRYEMAPMGRQWFGLQDWSQDALYNGAQRAAPSLNDYIDDRLQAHNLAANRLALVGFSQGCMMALHVGLRRPQALGAIIGFSGALVAPEKLGKTIASHPPILLVHGMMDTVVPYAAMPASAHYLEAAGLSVVTETRPMLGHSIDQESLTKAALFLHQHLGAQAHSS
jgi:phospholipase/carboxylesterase